MADGSIFHLPSLIERRPGPGGFTGIDWRKTAQFESREALDTHLRSILWRAEGGNHRCPSCVANTLELERSRQGMYIDLAEMGVA
jgi:hypothetical protein